MHHTQLWMTTQHIEADLVEAGSNSGEAPVVIDGDVCVIVGAAVREVVIRLRILSQGATSLKQHSTEAKLVSRA